MCINLFILLENNYSLVSDLYFVCKLLIMNEQLSVNINKIHLVLLVLMFPN